MISSSVRKQSVLNKENHLGNLQIDIEFLDQKQIKTIFFKIKTLLKTNEDQIFEALKLFLKLIKTLEKL